MAEEIAATVVAATVSTDAFGETDYGDLDDTLRKAIESDPEEEAPKKERKKRIKK